MLKKLFTLAGRKEKITAIHPAASVQSSPVVAQADLSRLITAYDSYGREIKIALGEWREQVLQPNLERHWDNSDELYNQIIAAMNDGLFGDIEPASARLLQIDANIERSHTVRGIVLMKVGRVDEAGKVIEDGMAKTGRTGTLLTNLAKVISAQGQKEHSEQVLREAVRADPNMENGLMWLLAIENERGGKAAYLQALQAAAALPGSWRPQLWLARHHLENAEVERALALYRKILVDGIYAADALMMISGDLGKNGHEAIIIDLLLPVYDVHRHSPQAGFNLLEAMIRQKRVLEGEGLLSRLYALGLAPYKQHLDHYAERLQAVRVATDTVRPVDPGKLDIRTLVLDRPVWSYGLNHPKWLFRQKSEGAEKVIFVPLALAARESDEAHEQREDDAGRLSRALPLYFAESVHYWTDRIGAFHLPVVVGGGPVVSSREADGAALCAHFPGAAAFIVTGCLEEPSGERPWDLSVKIWQVDTAVCIAEKRVMLQLKEDGQAVLELEHWLHEKMQGEKALPFDDFYIRLPPEAIQIYLSALGQGLMLTLTHNDVATKGAMWGERKMIEYPLKMALHWPGMESLKIFYLSGIGKAAGYRSDVLPEFAERTLQFLCELESSGSKVARLKPVVWKAFGMRDSLATLQPEKETDPLYREWLHGLMQEP